MPRSRPVVVALILAALAVAGVDAASPASAAQPADESMTDAPSPGQQLVERSLSLIGVRYRFGGTSPATGLDCSGLVQHVFDEALGFALPRRSEEMSRTGTPVSLDSLQPGDLVFFHTLRRAFSHVGIYIGENRFVHAPSSGGRVRIESIGSRYWARRFNGARRVMPEAQPQLAELLPAHASGEFPAGASSVRTRVERAFTRPLIANPSRLD
ncbi:MAG: C40 family peptidase [Burkholderiaceae bacterium]|jgi:cell wall-associated NlpC family hydrolase|nr:C40 family peptidase [Burkholderiaceae bacterium]